MNDDDSALEQHLRKLLSSICEVMQQNGYQEISVGAMMRLVGVDAKYAKKHDDVYMQLDSASDLGLDIKDHSMYYNPNSTTLH